MHALLAISLLTLAATDIQLATRDRVRIAATYTRPARVTAGTPAVILVPMYLNRRASWRAFAQAAARRGIASVAIDPRGHGDSANPTGRPVTRWGAREWLAVQRDIQAAKLYLRRQGFAGERILLVGASIGASLSLEYAVADSGLAGVGLLSPSTNLTGRTPEQNIQRIKGRPLFLAYSDDDATFAAIARRLAVAHGQPLALRRYRRAGHGTQMFGREDRPGDLTRSLCDWIWQVARAR